MGKNNIYKMSFASIYPLYVQKAERKGRTKEEVNIIINWLTGYDDITLQAQIAKEANMEEFFQEAPAMNPKRTQIIGKICGVQIEEIEEPLMKEIRYLDKLVDELAKGKNLDKVLPNEETFTTIDAYIAAQPEKVQTVLYATRDKLREVLPNTKEKISWGMPTFWDKQNIIHFAAAKNHLGIYPGPAVIEAFAERLSEYKTSKGAIQFPFAKPLPLELIGDIAKWNYVNRHSEL